jgi:hypothetical protein
VIEGRALRRDEEDIMSIRIKQLAGAALMVSVGLAMAGCKEKPFGARNQETINLSQVPAPVKATIDQQAQGRGVGEIEKQTTKGTTRYAVALGFLRRLNLSASRIRTGFGGLRGRIG